jgi:hypothetical protein
VSDQIAEPGTTHVVTRRRLSMRICAAYGSPVSSFGAAARVVLIAAMRKSTGRGTHEHSLEQVIAR